MVDLEGMVNWGASEALNTTKKDSLGMIFKQGLRDQELLVMESDADEQLLITLAFNTKVKLHSIIIDGPKDGSAPKDIKLFANKRSMSFDDAESANAEQSLELEPEMLGAKIELKFVKFQNVDSVTLFVGSNQGDTDATSISKVQFFGAEIGVTKMADFKRVAGNAGEGE